MSWQPTNFTPPPSITDAIDELDAMLVNADTELDNARNRLSAISHPFVNNPVSADVGGFVSVMAKAKALLDRSILHAFAHPWIEGVGHGVGVNRFLSPATAVRSLADKLNDVNDASLPSGESEAVAVMVYATNMVEFAERLAAFNAVFDFPEFKLAQRRAEQLIELPIEKVKSPVAAKNNRWQLFNGRKNYYTYILHYLVSAQGYSAGGYESSYDARSTLDSVMQGKQSMLESVEDSLSSIMTLFSGGAGDALFMDKRSIAEIASVVRDSETPGHENILCAAALLIGQEGDLTYIKEVLGL